MKRQDMERKETTYQAYTLDELLSVLQKLKETGYDMDRNWMGWDDGNIYVQPFKQPDWIAIDSGGSYT